MDQSVELQSDRRTGIARGPAVAHAPLIVLAAVVAVWLGLTLTVVVATPPWEANDEPDHVRNVESLVDGRWYRIKDGAGFEAHQAPLYYVVLAGWQRVLGIGSRQTAPVLRDPAQGPLRGTHVHDGPLDGADQRLVSTLRLPSVLFGLLTILLTAAIAGRLSSDPWTPPVAAAWLAGVPKFVFLSGVVSNDTLTTTLAAAATLLAVLALRSKLRIPARAVWLTAGVGAAFGAVVLTKLSAAPLGLPLAIAAAAGAGVGWRSRTRAITVFGLAALAVCGWWLVQNQVRYGDPFAATATHDHLERLFPPIFDVDPASENAFVTIPKVVYSSFWYTSGYNQFDWPSLVYAPLWIGLALALAGLAWRRRPSPAPRAAIVLLGGIVLVSLVGLWIVGLQTTTVQGRLAFTGLPSLACLAALGLQRARARVALRFLVPVVGALGTLVALQRDVFDVYF